MSSGRKLQGWAFGMVTLLNLSSICTARSGTYRFEYDGCSVSSMHVAEDDEVFLTYNGDYYRTGCRRMSFMSKDPDNPKDEYTVCITTVYYRDPNCATELEYSVDYRSHSPVEQRFKCHSIPKKYCGVQNERLVIEVIPVKSNRSNIAIMFRVQAEKTYKHALTVGAIAGGVCAGVICIVVGVVLFVVCRRRRAARAGQKEPNQSSEPLKESNSPTENT